MVTSRLELSGVALATPALSHRSSTATEARRRDANDIGGLVTVKLTRGMRFAARIHNRATKKCSEKQSTSNRIWRLAMIRSV